MNHERKSEQSRDNKRDRKVREKNSLDQGKLPKKRGRKPKSNQEDEFELPFLPQKLLSNRSVHK